MRAARLVIEATRSVMRAEAGLAPGIIPVTTPRASAEIADGFLGAVSTHRLVPLLAPQAEALGLDPGVAAAMASVETGMLLTTMANVVDVIGTSAVLDRAGIPHLVLKGVALAQQTTGSPLARGAGDIDLLVAPEDVARAVDALTRAGARRDEGYAPEPGSPLFPATLRTQQELVLFTRGTEVDLHWRLDPARGCMAWSHAHLMACAQQVSVGGATLSTLGAPHAAIFNASNATRDAWSRLRALVDHQRLLAALDVDAVRREAYRAGAGRRFDLARVLGALLLGVDPPAEVPTRVRAQGARLWSWLLAGEQPLHRRGSRAATRMFLVTMLSHDSASNVAQRSGTLYWPVRDMAARSLGPAGDAHPWLYPAATPFFLTRRALAKAGVMEPKRW